jgi:large-conductance mechanosensitive channel
MSFQALQTYFSQFMTSPNIVIGAVSIAFGMFLLNWITCFHQHIVSPYFRGWYGLTEWAKLRGTYRGVPVEWGSFLDGTLLYIIGIACLFGFYYQFFMKYENMEDSASAKGAKGAAGATGATDPNSEVKELPPPMQIERRIGHEMQGQMYNPTENIPVEPMWAATFSNFTPTAASV